MIGYNIRYPRYPDTLKATYLRFALEERQNAHECIQLGKRERGRSETAAKMYADMARSRRTSYWKWMSKYYDELFKVIRAEDQLERLERSILDAAKCAAKSRAA